MTNKIKPIQATPTLSGKDAKRIIKDVKIKPSKAAVNRNDKILAIRLKAAKNNALLNN